MSSRLPRWTWLLVLPMLVGALLLMHGLDAQAGGHHSSAMAASAGIADGHPDTEPESGEHGHCVECMAGDAMAACVAVIMAIGGMRLLRRFVASFTVHSPVLVVTDRARPDQ